MKAAVTNRLNGHFEIENIEIDKPRGREVLVEVKASGLCHSDLHMSENDFGITVPAVFGHEVAGVVIEIGPDVREFSLGDHVVGSMVKSCGHCRPCRQGRTYQCDNPGEALRGPDEAPRLSRAGERLTQVYGMGAFAEHVLIHECQLAKVPEALPFPQASVLGCGCVTGAGAAINTAGVVPGETVAVVGIGGIGLNVLAGARLAGAVRIIAIDTQPAKEALARKFGATDFICAGTVDPVEAVRALTGGVDHAFEAVGLELTTQQCINMVRKGGAVYLIGAHTPGTSISIDVTQHMLHNQLVIKGVYMGSSNIKNDIPMFAELYLQGRFNLDDLISKEISLDQINEAYRELNNGAIARCVITSF
ncbi:MAG TPA: Zn-dependent alcohol dehydrogenase [Novosphingobium sp.]|nr:Zn-dependent alcohol dehydrogenase [Novosphingobium sp.]